MTSHKKKIWKTHNLRLSNLSSYARRKGSSVTDVIICRQIWKALALPVCSHEYSTTEQFTGGRRGRGEVVTEKIGWGSTARFPKSLPYISIYDQTLQFSLRYQRPGVPFSTQKLFGPEKPFLVNFLYEGKLCLY